MQVVNSNPWVRSIALLAILLWMAMFADAGAPSSLSLDGGVLIENAPENTLVGTFSAVDLDPGDFLSFNLIPGDSDWDNHRFQMSGNRLLVRKNAVFDFESDPQCSIRVRVTDLSGLWQEKNFVIWVTNDRTEDADRDGLSEMDEEDVHGTSDAFFDFDGDGVGDGKEVRAGTSPKDANQWPVNALMGWGESSNGQFAAPEIGGLWLALSTGQTHSIGLTTAGAVNAWGGVGIYGQHEVPGNLGDVVAVAAGGDDWLEDTAFSLALRRNGSVTFWGYDHHGLMAVPEGLNQVTAIAAGMTHCLALKADGTVVAWGLDPHGWMAAPAGLSDVIEISAGGFHSLALKNDGTVVAWGSTFDGAAWREAKAPAGLSDVIAISAGRFHDLALKADGTVVAWGFNAYGQADPPMELAGVVAISAGAFHGLALKDDGSVAAWGLNLNGQTNVPASAGAAVRLISAGELHSIAVRQVDGFPAIVSNRRLVGAPGAATLHQVLVSNAVPLSFSAAGLPPGLSIDPASGLISGISVGAARKPVVLRVETDRGLLEQHAWVEIKTGSPPLGVSLSPSAVVENSVEGTLVGVFAVVDPDAGDAHTFELVDGSGAVDNGRFRIEGDQLEVANRIGRDFESNASGFSIRVRARDASLNPYEQVITLQFHDDRTEDADRDGLSEAAEEDVHHTSDAIADFDGDGFRDGFEVAHGTSPVAGGSAPSGRMVVAWGEGPVRPPAGLGAVIELAAGTGHCLAVRENGTVVGWGENGDGQAAVPAGLSDVVSVSAGDLHSIALKRDGTVVAWGNGDFDQKSVPAGLSGVVAISAGSYHNLALKGDGTVVAWGFNGYGQISVPSGLGGVVAVSAGGFHSLALKNDGTVVAWGSDWAGASTVPGGLTGVVEISAGGYHSLALRYDGTLVAWGENDAGQADVPEGAAGISGISAGWRHSLAVKSNGSVLAWGSNSNGQTDVVMEAVHVHKIAAGELHSLALREDAGFPNLVAASPVNGWPGESVLQSATVVHAAASAFSSMGLPAGLSMDPLTGWIGGSVASGERRSVKISAETDHGRVSRVIWINTADGVPPADVSLGGASVTENAPAGTVVGIFSVTDLNAGDMHTLELAYVTGAPDSFRFLISGNLLVLRYDMAADYDSGKSELSIRVIATDSGNNVLEKDLIVHLLDDRYEDADGDGVDEITEEDLLGTSDEDTDNFATADPDGDGVPSLLEYAFNLNPKVANQPLWVVPGAGSTAGLPAIRLVNAGGGQFRLRVEYLRRVGARPVYAAEFSDDMRPGSWQPAGNPLVVTPVDAVWERCVVDDFKTSPGAVRRFARVGVKW